MPFESKPVPRKKIENFIKEGQENTGIVFDKLEKGIVNKILNELPPSFNTGSLTKFCKNKVDSILSEYPDKKENADIIRNHVQKEILFDLYNEKFLEILEAIKMEKPQEVSPQWIRDRFPATSQLIRRTLKDTQNDVDWDFFTNKLGIKDIFRYQEKIIRNKEEAIADLEQLLIAENPETFSSIWIERKNDSLHTFLKENFLGIDGKTDWKSIVNNLDIEWKNRWTYRESERGIHLNEMVDRMIVIIKEKNPETFGPYWLSTNADKEYWFLVRNVRSIDGGVGWNLIADLLPPGLKEKWIATPGDKNWDFKSSIKELKTLLKSVNPETFNSRWVRLNNQGLYLFFVRNIRNKEGINWHKIIGSLPKEYQEKWKVRNEDKKRFLFNPAIKKLKKLIEEKKPEFITSGFIGQENPKLLSYFRENMKDDNGEIDWSIVVNSLDDDLKKICRFPKNLEQYKPRNEYCNEDEVDKVVSDNKNKLYTFFEILDAKDYEYRDKICLDFIRLVQKGNTLAKEKILDYLEILVTQWVEKEEKLKPFITNADLLRERIEKCVYYYNTEEGGIFLKYLRTSLLLEAKGLPTPRYIILNDTYKDGKESIESRMNFDLDE